MAGSGYQIQGTTQLQRTQAMPDPTMALPDDWTIERLLAFISSYSKLINYYNSSNQLSGDWSAFFNGDPIVTVAVISQTDTHLDMDAGIAGKDSLYDALQTDAHKISDLEGVIRQMYTIMRNVNQWSIALNRLPDRSTFKTELKNSIIESFDSSAQRIKTAVAYFNVGMNIPFPLLVPYLWHKAVSSKPDESFLDQLQLNNPQSADGSFNFPDMANVFRTELLLMHKVYVYIIKQAQQEFDRLMTQSNHVPHIALILSFLELYSYAQDSLNAFPSRLLDFYYQQMLQSQPAQGQPDSAYVTFALKPTSDGVLLAAGTTLSAGKDSNNMPIVYTTSNPTWVTQAGVGQILSLYLERDPVQTDVFDGDIITGMFYSTLNSAVVNTPGNTGSGWPVFGGTSTSSDGTYTTEYANIGFSISSPLLVLAEGIRSIYITVKLDASSYENLMDMVHAASVKTDVSDETLLQIITNAFSLRFTGAKDWITPENYILEIVPEEQAFRFYISLSAADPAVSGYNAAIHGSGYTTSDPVMEFRLEQGNFSFAYSFVFQLWIREITIEADVEDVRSLSLYNENGKIDPSKPFALLGVTPGKGSFLITGYQELFLKPVTDLKLTIDWGDLSMLNAGWQAYYHGYPMTVDNDSFQLGMTMLVNGRWGSIPGVTSTIPLFIASSAVAQSAPSPVTHIEVSGTETYPIWSPSSTPPAADYTISAQSGFFKLELQAPDYGFGQSLYSEVLTQTVLYNTKNKVTLPLPNKPFVPMAKSITLCYTAIGSIKFDSNSGAGDYSNGAFYHISPCAIYNATTPEIKLEMRNESPSTPDDVSLPLLVPYYEAQGYFFLGFTNADPGETISLLFQLVPPDGDDSDEYEDDLTWYFLVGNSWRPFVPELQPIDSTEEFLKTGTIEFSIPLDADTIHDVMPSGYYWIRATKEKHVDLVGNISALYTNAALAVYTPASTDQFLSKPLSIPPGSIKELTQPVEDIKAVGQPFYSFGGMMPESASAFQLRMAERLRHKDRAILPADYENITLQQFPYLYKAVCIRRQVNSVADTGGKVRLLVIPSVHSITGTSSYTPRLTLSQLEDIYNYLSVEISPMVKLEVLNPLYETIQVRAEVDFSGMEGAALYIRRINKDLVDYLCPWLNNPDANIQTGGVFSIPDLVNFIESQSYVKSLTNLSLLRVYKAKTGFYHIDEYKWPDVSEIPSSKPWSVFTSAQNHIITQVNDSSFPAQAGIGNLEIASNFIVIGNPVPAAPPPMPPLTDMAQNTGGGQQQPQFTFTLNLDKLNSL